MDKWTEAFFTLYLFVVPVDDAWTPLQIGGEIAKLGVVRKRNLTAKECGALYDEVLAEAGLRVVIPHCVIQ